MFEGAGFEGGEGLIPGFQSRFRVLYHIFSLFNGEQSVSYRQKMRVFARQQALEAIRRAGKPGHANSRA